MIIEQIIKHTVFVIVFEMPLSVTFNISGVCFDGRLLVALVLDLGVDSLSFCQSILFVSLRI